MDLSLQRAIAMSLYILALFQIKFIGTKVNVNCVFLSFQKEASALGKPLWELDSFL
jgi:hypothetical protein